MTQGRRLPRAWERPRPAPASGKLCFLAPLAAGQVRVPGIRPDQLSRHMWLPANISSSERPFTPGVEAAGEVRRVADNVSRLRSGDPRYRAYAARCLYR